MAILHLLTIEQIGISGFHFLIKQDAAILKKRQMFTWLRLPVVYDHTYLSGNMKLDRRILVDFI